MAALSIIKDLFATILPKKVKSGGATRTATYQPYAPGMPLRFPSYVDQLRDVAELREEMDSKVLIQHLLKYDPDMSATLHAYLTLADTEMIVYATDIKGNIDPDGSSQVHQILTQINRQVDYTKGFTLKEDLHQANANMRYLCLMRGGIASELVFDKNQPSLLRVIDSGSLRWFEPVPGQYKPGQLVQGEPQPRLLDYPTFRVSFYRRDPTAIYTVSDFVSAINTVVARQAVINDLYRIMRLTGFPRMDIKILESVIVDRAPLDVKADQSRLNAYVSQQIASVAAMFRDVKVDEALSHPDTVEIKILNDKAAGIAVDITPVIDTLNAQNQAALKTMATVIGRGASGVNTGSVEARMAAMYADQLNRPVAETWAGHLSYAMHQRGYQGWVHVKFRSAELRPSTELEPQLALKTARLRQDLSDGIITDIEYTLDMYGRLPHKDAPTLSGTGFITPQDATELGATPDPLDVSGNTNSLGRAVSSPRTKMGKSKSVKKKT